MGTRLTGRMEIFRPLAYRPDDLVPHTGDLNYAGVARLRDGVSIERARAELAAVEKAVDSQIAGESWAIVPIVTPLQQKMTGDVRQSLIVIMAGCGRGATGALRQPGELVAVARPPAGPASLPFERRWGASRWQLATQSLAETSVIAALGGGLGILLAYLGMQRLLAAAPIDLPRLRDVSVDGRVLLFALGISALTALLFGILPALRTASSDAPYETLKSTNYANAGGPMGFASAQSAGGFRGRPVRRATGYRGIVSGELRPVDHDSARLRYRARARRRYRPAVDEIHGKRGCDALL
ncbi:MAG: FtsX-like permease family protein [Ignavibacteriota bacterium]